MSDYPKMINGWLVGYDASGKIWMIKDGVELIVDTIEDAEKIAGEVE